MIVFHSIKYKNFLSTGDAFTTIQLDDKKSTLIVGQNGAGKSTMLDAISFALFGKPHRNINKPQLVNSINQKQCVVEVEFTVKGNRYKVVRGIKPAKFEIWKGDQLLNQNSHNKEYQKVLEQNILKLNHKSFHQIVVLGSSSFIPFMQLPAYHRREVIEDLLDIGVFGKMNVLLKERMATIKQEQNKNEHEIDILDTKISAQKKYIRDLAKLQASHRAEKEMRIQEIQRESVRLSSTTAALDAELSSLDVTELLGTLQTQASSLTATRAGKKRDLLGLVKEAKFYEKNDNCPTCDQDISSDLKRQKISESKDAALVIKSEMDAMDAELESFQSGIDKALEQQDKYNQKKMELAEKNELLRSYQNQIQTLQTEIAGLTDSSGDVAKAKFELTHLESEEAKGREAKIILKEKYDYMLVLSELLKDSGIKTKIIKQYLPVINKLVNQYLSILDFFVSFELDENFNETIKSRHRDEFSYASFSEGEKQRIDLALLFTWRQVAKMKNSISTNLLVLDETFDSSLDGDGVENLLKILHTLGDETNIFIISHKGDILEGKFEGKMEFYKDKNFSKMR